MQVKGHGPEVAWRGWTDRALLGEKRGQILSVGDLGWGSLQVTVPKVWV